MGEEAQKLGEFIQNLIDDLESGALSPQEVLTAAGQYAYVRESIANNYSELSSTLTNPEGFVVSVKNVLVQAQKRLENLPSFQGQSPDKPTGEEGVRAIAALRTAAVDQIKDQTDKKLLPYKDKRRAFIQDLIKKYSSTLPVPPNEQSIEKVVDGSLLAAAGSATTTKTRERFAELLVASATVGSQEALDAQTTQKLTQAITSSLEQNAEYVGAATAAYSQEKNIFKILLTHIDAERPDVVADVLLHAPTGESAKDAEARAVKLAAVAAQLEKTSGPLPVVGNFFSSGNAKGVAKGLQQGADGLLSLVGEPFREMIIKEKVNGTLRNALTGKGAPRGGGGTFIDRLGESFVRSSIFGQIMNNMTHAMNERQMGGGARGLFDDVVSSVFRGPLNNVLTKGANDQLSDFLELARANAAAPQGRKFLPTDALPWNISYNPTVGSRKRASWLPTLGLGGFGAWLGSIGSSMVDRATSFTFASPRVGNEMGRWRSNQNIVIPFWEDMPLFLTTVILVTILLLFVLPSPFNGTLLNYSNKVSGLLASLVDITNNINELPDLPGGSNFICSWAGVVPPEATITRCPVNGGSITQGPNGGFSHQGLNAYDFGDVGMGTPVYAAHNSYVVSYSNSLAPNQKDGGYGNNVILVSTNPTTKQQYCTNYAHLLDVAPVVVSNAGQPVLVPAGTLIGYTDDTGKSFGAHLHWGHSSGGPFLPPGCP